MNTVIFRDWWIFGGPDRYLWILFGDYVDRVPQAGQESSLVYHSDTIIDLDLQAGTCRTRRTLYLLEGPGRVVPTRDQHRSASCILMQVYHKLRLPLSDLGLLPAMFDPTPLIPHYCGHPVVEECTDEYGNIALNQGWDTQARA